MMTADAQRQRVVTVAIRDFYFEPSQLVIEPGTAVQWVNESTTRHTVFATSPAGAFRSGTLHPGESFTHTFPQRFPKASPDSRTKPGRYEYLCEIHPGMKASVTFSESGGKAPTQEKVPTQGREVPAVQQPPTVPRTGGLDPLNLIGLLVVMPALGALGWESPESGLSTGTSAGASAGDENALSSTALDMVASKRYIFRSFLGNKAPGVSGDHQVFVGSHHAHGHRAAVAGDDGRMRRVPACDEPDAEELQSLADAQRTGAALAPIPTREDQGVQPTQNRCQRPEELLGLVAEEGNRLGRMRLVFLAPQ